MPVYPNTPLGRRSIEAFEIVNETGLNPLKEAISAALKIEEPSARCQAWIKVAEFVYAKPKQAMEVSGSLTLGQLLTKSWDEPITPQIQEVG